jgi:tryptophan halogenase
MDVPDTLSAKIAQFRASGRVFRDDNELFVEPSCVQVMIGQRILPRAYHPLVDALPLTDGEAFLADLRRVIARCVDVMPDHGTFISEHGAASASI